MFAADDGLVPSVASAQIPADSFAATGSLVASDVLASLTSVLVQSDGVGSLAAQVAGRFLGTLIVGAILGGIVLTAAPRFGRDRTTAAGRKPGGYFLWGLAGGVLVPIVLLILAVTIVGLVVAIPGAFALAIGSLLSTGLAVLWVGSWLGDDASLGGREVAVGALVAGILNAIPIVGSLAWFVVTTITLGTVTESAYVRLRGWRRDDGDSGPSRSAAGGHRQ